MTKDEKKQKEKDDKKLAALDLFVEREKLQSHRVQLEQRIAQINQQLGPALNELND